jgi:hypothetical protein
MTENEVGKVVVDAAIAVNKTLGEREKEGFLRSPDKKRRGLSPDKRHRGQGAA